MSQSTDTPTRDEIRSVMLDANEALKDEEDETAFAKLKEAQRRCGILLREGDGE